MKFLPGKPKRSAVRKIDAPVLQRIDPLPPTNPFFSFTYSSHEMHIADGRTHVKAKQVRFEDGRIKTEQFEGQLPANVYEQTLGETQRFFADQTMSMLNGFSALFSLPMKHPRDKE